MPVWLDDVRQNNRGWDVVERAPNGGLHPIWDLVSKSGGGLPTSLGVCS